MRYELKYTIQHLSYDAVKSSLMCHPASFTMLYPDRRINNYYFDTPDFLCFHQNIDGLPNRKKLRLRWYGDYSLPTKNSTLELKIKERELGYKELFPIENEISSKANLMDEVSATGKFTSELNPVLKNTYERSYFISADKKYRVTIDRDQAFAIPFSDMRTIGIKQYPIILEIKFDKKDIDGISNITDFLPYRQSKNSKYATGVEEIYMQ